MVLILVKIKQFIVLIMRTYVLGIAGQVQISPFLIKKFCFGFVLDCANDLSFWKTATLG